MVKPIIGIIGGKGRMGSLFAAFFRERGVPVLISDVGTKLTNKELAEKSDITIVSVPIDYTEKVIREVLPYVKDSIMDFTSVKEMPVKAMLKGRKEVLGMHPMFGNSNPIPNQTIILTPTKKSGKWSKWLENFLLENNVKVIKMSPKEHDKIMNIAQGLIHFAEITFADALRRTKLPVRELLKYTGRASELKVQLAARLIDQDPGLYGNIQIQNPQALKSLKAFKDSVDELIKIVAKKDLLKFKKYFEQNKKFYGSYTKEAYVDSSYLIDKLLEKQNSAKKSPTNKPQKKQIAVLGPMNTHTHLAAQKYSPQSSFFFARTIDEVFELVESGKVRQGIVPIENKLNGTIRETLDNLFARKVHIKDEINIPIHHCLIAFADSHAKNIKKIFSHNQALAQCGKYLKKNFPKAELIETASTGAAIENLITTNNLSLAAIAPEVAAGKNLKILAKNIEDQSENSTTFVIVEKGQPKAETNAKKTSIAFHFSADSPGSLFAVLQDFAENKINITKIESRPTKARFGDYIFYLDFEGSLGEAKVKKALKAIGDKVAKLKILGSY